MIFDLIALLIVLLAVGQVIRATVALVLELFNQWWAGRRHWARTVERERQEGGGS